MGIAIFRIVRLLTEVCMILSAFFGTCGAECSKASQSVRAIFSKAIKSSTKSEYTQRRSQKPYMIGYLGDMLKEA